MPESTLTVLAVTRDPSVAKAVAAACDRLPPDSCELVVMPETDASVRRLESRHADVVFVDLRLADLAARLDVVAQLHRTAGAHHLVALVNGGGPTRDALLAVGADDVMLRDPLDVDALVMTLLRSAGNRWTADGHELQDRELAGLARLGSIGTSRTARSLGLVPLADSPGYAEYLHAYRRALRRAVSDQPFTRQDEAGAAPELLALAQHLGAHLAGPRDLVAFHTRALRDVLSDTAAPQRDVLLAEARLALITLLGHLVSYYRSRAVPARSPAAKVHDHD